MTNGNSRDPEGQPGTRPLITGLKHPPHGIGLHALPGRAAAVAVVLAVLCLFAWLAGILP